MSTTPRRLMAAERRDDDVDASLRPQRLSEFIGQEKARANLSVFIEAARARKEALDHVLFVGPPGLGKTTLAQIVARELGVNFRATSGPVIAKAGDLAALLTNLEPRDVLFIDEIHRLNPAVEEILYPAMEDFQLDLIIGEGPAARSVKIELAPFTLVGATTRAGLLTNPLRDRFGIPVRLNFYSEAELEQIVNRGARVLKLGMSGDGANEIARRARGTPRIAGRLLRRVRDFAHVDGAKSIDRKIADKALGELEVDAAGLDAMDRRYLSTIALNYGGGPVGVDTMAAALSEPRDAIEDIIEPFLIQKGFIQRTPRGRLLTSLAFKHLGLAEPRAIRASLECLMARTMSSAVNPLDGEIRDGRHYSAGAGLLRGHGFFRRRLSRQLSALHGARAHQLSAPDRRRSPRHVRAGREGSARLCLRGAPHEHRLPQTGAHGRRARHRHRAGRGEGRLRRCSIRRSCAARIFWSRRTCRWPSCPAGGQGRSPSRCASP